MRKYIVYAIIKAKNREHADDVCEETSPHLSIGTLHEVIKEYEKK